MTGTKMTSARGEDMFITIKAFLRKLQSLAQK